MKGKINGLLNNSKAIVKTHKELKMKLNSLEKSFLEKIKLRNKNANPKAQPPSFAEKKC